MDLKHFSTVRVSNPPIFDLLLYFRAGSVVATSLRHWPNTFLNWTLPRLEGFLEACKNPSIELIESSSVEYERFKQRATLKDYGLSPMNVYYSEYYSGQPVTGTNAQKAAAIGAPAYKQNISAIPHSVTEAEHDAAVNYTAPEPEEELIKEPAAPVSCTAPEPEEEPAPQQLRPPVNYPFDKRKGNQTTDAQQMSLF